jgi:hypothetical protein
MDGVGIGPPDPDINPFLQARLPILRTLLHDRIPVLGDDSGIHASPTASTLDQSGASWPEGSACPLDPLMGVDGSPQSGTGQTALLTGENAAALYGRHFGPWIPVPLRPLMLERNVLSRALALGISCAFANAYPRKYHHLAWSKRPAGPPLAAHGAGLLDRHEDHLAQGTAVSSEILNTAWRAQLGFTHLPKITPAEAGRNLARISEGVGLTFFAHYSTDTAGHERNMEVAVGALERVDAFLGGLVPALPPETLLVLASDHGNIEDISQGHTRNPVLCILLGPGAEGLAQGISRITDVPGLILDLLTSLSM